MVEEAYVSFETAKLLKERGFDTPVWTRYENNDDDSNEVIFGDKYNWNDSPMGQISAPTQQMAMRWLREVHNIHIVLMIENNGNYIGYLYDTKGNNIQGWDKRLSKTSYEEAVDAVIQYILENLI